MESFVFEYGSAMEPSGNCLMYCGVVNDLFFFPQAKWIASNVYVSYLLHQEKLPVVAFPPVPITDPSLLFQQAKMRSMDILRIEDFAPPSEIEDAKKYFEKRAQEFNRLVISYVELCKTHIKQTPYTTPELHGGEETGDTLEKLNALEQKIISTLSDGEKKNLHDIFRLWSQEAIAADGRFDFQNLWAVYQELDQSQDLIIHLFFDKFRAIHLEDYEKARMIQDQINRTLLD